MIELSLHIKSASGGFQLKGHGIILTYQTNRGGYHRALKQRAIDHMYLLTREATQKEWEAESSPWRMDFLQYRDWDRLIADEMKWTKDKVWLQGLHDLKAKWPQFKQAAEEQRGQLIMPI